MRPVILKKNKVQPYSGFLVMSKAPAKNQFNFMTK